MILTYVEKGRTKLIMIIHIYIKDFKLFKIAKAWMFDNRQNIEQIDFFYRKQTGRQIYRKRGKVR